MLRLEHLLRKLYTMEGALLVIGVKRTHKNGSMSYDYLKAKKRTHESFVDQTQAAHYNGTTPRTPIQHLNVISQFPLYYMHLVLLRTMRKITFTGMSKCHTSFPLLKYICLKISIGYLENYMKLNILRGACTSWVDMLTNHSIDLKFQYCV